MRRHPFPLSWRGAAAATIAAGLTLGGLAVPASAAPGAAPTVVKVCVNKKSGAMRQVRKKSKCRSTERFLKWNTAGRTGATGPTGPTGPAGPSGRDGATGTPGPSHSYQTLQSGTTDVPGATPVTIASVTVPAGTYVLSGQVASGLPSAASVTVLCGFVAGGTSVEGPPGVTIVPTGDIRQLIAAGSYTAPTTTTISLACAAIGGSVTTQYGGLIATQVGALN